MYNARRITETTPRANRASKMVSDGVMMNCYFDIVLVRVMKMVLAIKNRMPFTGSSFSSAFFIYVYSFSG